MVKPLFLNCTKAGRSVPLLLSCTFILGYEQSGRTPCISTNFLLHVLGRANDRNEKKSLSDVHRHPPSPHDRSQCEKGRDHHHSPYSTRQARTAILTDSSGVKASLLGIEDRLIVQVGESVAFLRSSEEDVYYRIDSICRTKSC